MTFVDFNFLTCPEHDECTVTVCTCCRACTHAPAGYAVTTGHGLCSWCSSVHGGAPLAGCPGFTP